MAATQNARIRSMDIPIIDRVLGMEGGVVLNFSNRTFANFFHEEFGIDIYDDRWAAQGNSKANRLRCYLLRADRRTALHTLDTFWAYREASSVTAEYPALEDSVRTAYFRWKHEIPNRANEPRMEQGKRRWVPRNRRISLTFRKVRPERNA